MMILIKRWQKEYLRWTAWSLEQQREHPPWINPRIEQARLRRQLAFDLRLFGCKLKDIGAYVGCSVQRAREIIERERREIRARSNRHDYL